MDCRSSGRYESNWDHPPPSTIIPTNDHRDGDDREDVDPIGDYRAKRFLVQSGLSGARSKRHGQGGLNRPAKGKFCDEKLGP